MDKAMARSEELHRLFKLLFSQDRHPEQLYRSCDGLLSLSRKTSSEVFEKACLMAIEHQNYSYGFVLNIIKNKMTDQKNTAREQALPNHKNIRGKDYYTQSQIKF